MIRKSWKNGLCAVLIAIMAVSCVLPISAAAEMTGDAEIIPWPGSKDVRQVEKPEIGAGNASGLDFHNGNLYAVDNGTAGLQVLEVLQDGTLRYAAGYEEEKRIRFADPDIPGQPDVEGITVSDDGSVYVATERDNRKPWVSSNRILRLNPWTNESVLTALQEWDLTAILPSSLANSGIEAVEWVHGSAMTGCLPDHAKQKLFDMADYPQAVSDGIFFVLLEMNDHLYACILNRDGTACVVADIEPGLQGIAALEYDQTTGVLWAASDDRGENRLARLLFSEGKVTTEFVLPPESLDISHNNEGFAIAEESYTENDSRPVYWLRDGVYESALTIGSLTHHIHVFSEEWQKEAGYHWQACVCGVRQNQEAHSFANIVTDAAQKSPAVRNHTAVYYPSCLVCGALDTGNTFSAGQTMDPERLTTPVAIQIFGIPQM